MSSTDVPHQKWGDCQPAWQHFEEDEKGSIEVGKLADFVILSDDPKAVDPEILADLEVLAAIKENTVIFEAQKGERETHLEFSPFSNDPATAHAFLHAIHEGMKGEHP